MRQRKCAEILFSLSILAILAGILVTSILRPKDTYSVFENRSLAEQPQATWETVGDGSFFQDIESYCCDYAAFRTTLMKGAAWVDMNLFHRPVINGVVVTDQEILLSYLDYETVDETAIRQSAEAMAEQLSQFSQLVEAYGGTFLYVAIPSHYAYYQDRYPSYLNNRSAYTSVETSALFSALESKNVPYLDVGEQWQAEGYPTAYMSSVDHHYTWAGCFSAYQQVMATLNDLGEASLRVLQEDDLTLHTLPNPYLGSRSRKLCGQWQSTERLVYGTLTENIDFLRYDWGNDFPGTSSMVVLPETGWEDATYTIYMGGDISETIIETDRLGLPTALVFGDSFTNPMESLLYASFDEMRSLDMRSYTKMTLADYVKQYQPDVVICIRDYEQLLNFTGNGCLFG
jgi:hypothetical protein